jgi:hypothetical protein
MSFEELTELFLSFLNAYYARVAMAKDAGDIELTPTTAMLFPTMLLATETDSHYVIELIGASSELVKLESKRHKELSVNRYISQMSVDSPDSHLRVDVGYRIYWI